MDRKHFLKGSEAREQALLQRNLETQTRPEVTPFINTQTALRSRTSCFCAVQYKEKPFARIEPIWPRYLTTSVCLLLTEGGSLTGYEISDMPHPPSLSQSTSFA